jgi:outer membrane receptor protein involved in Fe transport
MSLRFRAAAALFGLVLGFGVAEAQITGSVTVTVVDPQGRGVPAAKTALRSVETGSERAAQTDDEGRFTFNLVQIGSYEVRVEASGFRVALAAAEVKAGEITSLRLPLEVGTVSETVTVAAAVALLDVENSQMQVAVVGRALQELPVGRNLNLFAITAPGTVPVSANNPFLGSGSFNVNGMRGRGNNITVDGITATDISVTGTGGTLTAVNFSSIKEVKIITNNYSAEYGRNVGSEVLYLSKNGTSEFHGELYEYFRNDKLNARSFFDRSGKAAVNRWNQFGYSIGGPVLIPGLYNGRNRTHFYTDLEQVKVRGASAPRIARVPTPEMIAQVTDPTSRSLLEQYKLPSSGSGSIEAQASETTDVWLWSVRVDHNISNRDVLWARFNPASSLAGGAGLTFIQSNLPGFGARSENRPKYAMLAETHYFGSATNEIRFGFGQSKPNFPINTPYPMGPRIQFSNGVVDRFGVWEGLPQGREQRTYQFWDNFSVVRGAHNLKTGLEYYQLAADSVFDALFRPLITFADWPAFVSGTPLSATQRFGNSVRENRVKNTFAFFQDDWKATRNLTFNLGVRYEWSGGPMEKNGMISNLNFANQTAFGAAGSGPFGLLELGKPSFNSNSNWGPRVGFAWSPGSRKTVIRGGYGIMYDFVFLNPITNQRFLPPFIVTGTVTGAASFTGDNSLARIVAGTSAFQTATRAQAGSLSTSVVNFGAISPAINQDLRNAQAQHWNFGVQHELFGVVVKASYVGTKGNYLPRSRDLNLIASPVAPATSTADETARLSQFQTAFQRLNGTPTVRSNRIDPRYNAVVFVDSSANSNYHGFQLEVLRRVGSVQLSTNYTVGKAIDDGSDVLGVLINDSPNQQNPLDNRNNRAPSQFDIRQRLVLTHIWSLPWLKNASNPFLRHILGGWNFAGITTFRTGFPVTLDAGGRRGIDPLTVLGGGAAIRPNVVGPVAVNWVPTGSAGAPQGTVNPDGVSPISSYANSLGLSQPLLGNFGTLGRNALRLNGERNFNWNVYKQFTIAERRYLEIRAEMYNAFNNTSFQDVNRNIANPAFGTYTTVGQDYRIIQMAARLVF